MKFPRLNPYYTASFLLVVAAAVQLAVAILTDYRDLTSAALVVSSVICFITGIFLAILSTTEPLDIRYVSRLPVQGCITVCRICADLGIQGNGHFIPAALGGAGRTMLFVPVASFEEVPSPGGSFVYGAGSAGLLVEPSGAALYAELRNRQNLIVPREMSGTLALVKETGEDVLEISGRITAEMNGDTIHVTLNDYLLIDGCLALYAESPRCCTTYPCPVCSLFATLIAEGAGKTVTLERCTPDMKDRSVSLVFTMLPGDDRQPEVEVPVT